WCIAAFAVAILSGCKVLSSYVDLYSPVGEPLRAPDSLQGTYALPRTVLDIQVKTGDNHAETLSIAKKVEADPRTRLLYRFEPSSTSDDILEVQTDEAGLLTSVTTDTKDESGAIILKLAETVFVGVTGGANAPQTADLPEGG